MRRSDRSGRTAMGRIGSVILVATVALGALGALGAAGAVGASASTAARRVAKFRLTSPAFANGAAIPDGFTCDGAGASPTLRWRGVPRRAVQLALIVEDPDAPGGTLVHWVAWGIDPAAGRLVEQAVPPGMIQGTNSVGRAAYLGPCPPPGAAAHHYHFTLYALAKAPTVAAGASAAALRKAIKGNVLGTARLVGTYARRANAPS